MSSTCTQRLSFIPIWLPKRRFLNAILRTFGLSVGMEPVKFSYWEKNHIVRTGLLKDHPCKTSITMSSVIQKWFLISTFPYIHLLKPNVAKAMKSHGQLI